MRIEKGHVAGNELNGTTTAGDLGLGRLMSRKKDFIGSVLAGRPGLTAADRPVLVGVKPVDRTRRLHAGAHFLNAGVSATLENDQGFISSVAFSATLGHWIALGFLANGASRHGERILAHDPLRGADVEVEVTHPVFYDPEGLRLTDKSANAAPRSPGSRPSATRVEATENRQADTTAGLYMCLRPNVGLARIIVRKNARSALAQRFRAHFGMDLPQTPTRVSNQHVAAIGLAPDAWLLTWEEGRDQSLAHSLQSSLGDSVSICDQTDAYVIVCLTGPKVRETLAKLLPIDLHPRNFHPGAAAQTVAHHVGVILWRRDDIDGQHPAFELAVPRSLFSSLREALCQSAAEFVVKLTK